MSLDPAIVRLLLSIHGTSTSTSTMTISIQPTGHSAFTRTARISIHHRRLPNSSDSSDSSDSSNTMIMPSLYFLKHGSGSAKASMFSGEHVSLNAIHDAVPSLCPRSLGHGALDGGKGGGGGGGGADGADGGDGKEEKEEEEDEKGEEYFLLTEFLDSGGNSGGDDGGGGDDEEEEEKRKDLKGVEQKKEEEREGKEEGESLARKLARLHTSTNATGFGFPVTTFCGDTPQPNDFKAAWSVFFAENRLLPILALCELRRGADGALRALVEQTAERVVPWLLNEERLLDRRGGKKIRPVLVHGDLWSGNVGRGRIGGIGRVEAMIFDPSAVFGHAEYELGIMRMFGGFGEEFFDEYHALCPRAEPEVEYDDRIRLYELYHHLNHYAIFGGGYRSRAVSIMKGLIEKYSKKIPCELRSGERIWC